MDTITLELDIAGELGEPLAAMLHEVTKDYDTITYRVVHEVGPAAWPVVRFVGAPHQVYAFLLEYYGGDHEAAYDYLLDSTR